MVEDDVGHFLDRAGHLVDRDRFPPGAKLDTDRPQEPGAGQGVEMAVARRQYGCAPAMLAERGRQIADDVADTADLAAAQCRVLCSQEDDVPGTDKGPA